ncbi:hypothetical protein ACFC6L_13155 [Kitasatospora phosalacinea]|uniref:COG4315 family predicted lipoprotein n=1 Tax=Kitasatospora phosalacinea TaxID=2065 RepID=UPI0035DC882B
MPRTRRVAAAAVLSLTALSALLSDAGCSAPADLNAPPAVDSPSATAPSPGSGPSVSAFATSVGTRVALASVGNLGPILVDAQGRALYLYGADTSVHASCLDECAKSWPPVTTPGFPLAGPGVDDGLLGAAALPDGTAQVLYKGHPLYRYAGDRGPGESAGHTVADPRGTFYAVTSLGDPVGVDIATLRGAGGAVPSPGASASAGASAGASASASAGAPAADPNAPAADPNAADPNAPAQAPAQTPAPADQQPAQQPAQQPDQQPAQAPVEVPPAQAPAEEAPAEEAPTEEAPAGGGGPGAAADDGSQEG